LLAERGGHTDAYLGILQRVYEIAVHEVQQLLQHPWLVLFNALAKIDTHTA
jgi:hypothetical protein